jgi:glycosyltransferase involved in cell wall biosynthesis
MRTLILANGAPYPPRSGSPLRTWQNVNVFAARGPVCVFSLGHREPDADTMPVAAEWTHLTAADLPPDRGLRSRALRVLRSRPYPIAGIRATAEIDRLLSGTIERFNPDLIVLEHWKNSLPRPLKRQRKLLLDMHNVESLLATEGRSVRNPLLRELMKWRWRRRERALARGVKQVWVCGENDVLELARLDRRLPRPYVWPNCVDLERYAPVRDGTLQPQPFARNGATIAYIGFYPYAPNADAARELIETIFPIVAARLPHTRLLLIGAAPNAAMYDAAARDPRIVVTGTVDDIRPYLAATDLALLPIRSGGGTRLKILESFAAHVPVVATAKGAEGIALDNGREIRFAESAAELANEAVALLQDDGARTTQIADADALVRARYSWTALEQKLEAALSACLPE